METAADSVNLATKIILEYLLIIGTFANQIIYQLIHHFYYGTGKRHHFNTYREHLSHH